MRSSLTNPSLAPTEVKENVRSSDSSSGKSDDLDVV